MINTLEEVEGRTIKAEIHEWDRVLFLFTDGTDILIKTSDNAELYVANVSSFERSSMLFEVGGLSEKVYNVIKAEEESLVRAKEINTLKFLRKRYPDV